MTRKHFNATSLTRALAIAEHAAQNQTPAGVTMTVDRLIDTELTPRPFARVALAEPNATATYIFEVTITREDDAS